MSNGFAKHFEVWLGHCYGSMDRQSKPLHEFEYGWIDSHKSWFEVTYILKIIVQAAPWRVFYVHCHFIWCILIIFTKKPYLIILCFKILFLDIFFSPYCRHLIILWFFLSQKYFFSTFAMLCARSFVNPLLFFFLTPLDAMCKSPPTVSNRWFIVGRRRDFLRVNKMGVTKKTQRVFFGDYNAVVFFLFADQWGCLFIFPR